MGGHTFILPRPLNFHFSFRSSVLSELGEGGYYLGGINGSYLDNLQLFLTGQIESFA